MKKLLLLFAVLLGTVGAWGQTLQKVPHSQWTVTAPNQYSSTSGNEGGVDFIKDENPATFYHSDWSGSKPGQDGLQGFMVDMGEEISDITKITYAGRSDNNKSGWARGVKIYLYTALPVGLPNDLSSVAHEDKDHLFYNADVLGTPAFDNTADGDMWADDLTLKTAEFSEPQTARYVLFVMHTGHDNWLTCADFNVWQNVDILTLTANGSLEVTFNDETWQNPANVPGEVVAVESTQWPNKESKIMYADIEKFKTTAGYVIPELIYDGGNKRLEILGVELLDAEGNVVSSDYHFGYSGGNRENHMYTLKVDEAATYTLRYWMTFCSEPNQSYGRITIYHKELLPVKTSNEFANNKVYTVTPADYASTGVWDVMADGSKLSISRFAGTEINPTSKNQQFAFLSVNNEFYLYSYGKEKFVAKDGGAQKLTDELSSACLVEFLSATHPSKFFYPLVVQVDGSQLHSSYQAHLSGSGGIITTWDHPESGGNALSILPVEGEVDLSSAIAKIEAYQIAREKSTLKELIYEATTLAGKTYLGEANITALNTAKQTAQGVYDNATATYADVTAQITALTNAINNALYVTTVEGFSNNAIYTFIANRDETSYMMYDYETPDYVASHYMKTSLEVGDENINCQWAVYKSNRGYYYIYNLGAQKFMGTESAANTSIPFSATPQTTGLKFKATTVASHPIMFTTNNGSGVANHSNDAFDGKNKAGLINWSGGYNQTGDAGNVHKVTIVGEIDEEILATIEAAVELYETRGLEIQALDTYLKKFYSNYYDAWGTGWRNKPGLNNYTQPEEDEPLNEAYTNAVLFYEQITDETPIEDIRDKKAYLEGLEANLTINLPTNGQFVRLRCTDGKKYLQSTTNESNNRLTMTGNNGVESYFTYYNGYLISYTTGKSIDHRVYNEIGASSDVIFSEAHNGDIGCYNIKVGTNYIYGSGSDIDSGSNPDHRNGYNWWLEDVTSLPITISAAGYATFYCPVAVILPGDLKAYAVSEAADGKAMMTEINGTIPANTGVILKGSAGTYELTIATETSVASDETNLLTGTVASAYVEEDSYVLSKQTEGVGFYKAMKNFYNNNGTWTKDTDKGTHFLNNGFKAYLPKPEGTPDAARFFVFDFGTETAIEGIEAENTADAVVYDLAGRRVQNAHKGVFIVNGKVVIK